MAKLTKLCDDLHAADKASTEWKALEAVSEKEGFAKFLHRIGELLMERYGVKETYTVNKLVYSRPASGVFRR